MAAAPINAHITLKRLLKRDLLLFRAATTDITFQEKIDTLISKIDTTNISDLGKELENLLLSETLEGIIRRLPENQQQSGNIVTRMRPLHQYIRSIKDLSQTRGGKRKSRKSRKTRKTRKSRK
jgi:hypothetical protein